MDIKEKTILLNSKEEIKDFLKKHQFQEHEIVVIEKDIQEREKNEE